MTTVADLVAKLGFQVDTRGFDNFKKSLESFQSVVRSGLKDLKDYAKQAEKISKAFKEAYLPSRADADKRYRAEIYAMRARAYAQRVRARALPETLSIRRYNAQIRDRQTALKEMGVSSVGGASTQNGILGLLLRLSGGGGLLGGALGALGGLIGSLFGPIGRTVGETIGRIVGGILIKVGGFIISQMRQATKYMMSFVDYKRFTGRSSNELSGLMEMTKHTANMNPEDVLRDAQRMGQEYWDLWFGGGNPQFWQMLRLRPTMNGQQNLQNALQRIYELSGGMKTEQGRGLALKMARMGGLEDYMPILDKWERYKSTGGQNSFFRFSDEEIAQFEKTNEALRKFGQAVDTARIHFVNVILNSGLESCLKSIANYLAGIVLAFKSGKIHDKSSFFRHLFAFEQMEKSGSEGRYITRSEIEERNGRRGYWNKLGWLREVVEGSSMVEKALGLMGGTTTNNNGTTINNFNNNIDMAGRSPQEATETIVGLNNGQININAALHSVPLY